jgi:hypothetical protein
MTDYFTTTKKIRALPIAAALAAAILTACLNPVDFKPELQIAADMNVTGEIDMNATKKDSAVLTVVNRTMSIDVVNTTVRARSEYGALLSPAAIDYGNPAASPPLEGRPLHNRRAEWYLAPSQWDYEITMTYKSIDPAKPVAPGAGLAETRTAAIIMPMARPGQAYYVYIARTKDGVILVDKENPPSSILDPDDAANPKPDPADPDEGEGSSPAVIPPKNRDKMGVFVVVNKTRTTDIDYVQFTAHHSLPVKSFTMGFSHGSDPTMSCANAVALNTNGILVPYPHSESIHEPGRDDQMSIALKQSAWAATVNYRVAGGYPNPSTLMNKSLTRNVVVSPVNDPMALKTNFLYFYRTAAGDYALSPEWPAPDAEDKTSVEVDDGSALFIIRNNAANSYVHSLKVVNYHGDKTAKTIDYKKFVPFGYGGYGTSKKAFFTPDGFPFENGKQYEVQVLIFDERVAVNKIVVSTRFLNINLGGTYIIDIGRPEVDGAVPLPPDIPPQARLIVKNRAMTAIDPVRDVLHPAAYIKRIDVKTMDGSKVRTFAADHYYGEDWDQSFAATAGFPFVQGQSYKVSVYADIHYHIGTDYGRSHVCENPPATLAWAAHDVPFEFTVNGAGNPIILHDGTGSTVHEITLGGIPMQGFKPVTNVTGMPTVVDADKTLTLGRFVSGSYQTAAGTAYSYGPIQALPVDATALHLPRPDLGISGNTKITWGFAGSPPLADTVNAEETKASINSAARNWTMKVLEASTTNAAGSQKVLLTPPAGPYAGAAPQTKVFIQVEYGTGPAASYRQEFTINATDVALPFVAVTGIDNLPGRAESGLPYYLGRGRDNPSSGSGVITVQPPNATAVNLPQPLIGISGNTHIEWEFHGYGQNITLTTQGQKVMLESLNKDGLSPFPNMEYKWELELLETANALGSQVVKFIPPLGMYPYGAGPKIEVTAKVSYGAAPSGNHVWTHRFAIIAFDHNTVSSAPWDVMWGSPNPNDWWGSPPRNDYHDTRAPLEADGIGLLKGVANDVLAYFTATPSLTPAAQAWSKRVYKISSGNAKIVGPSGEDYGTFYDARFWSHGANYKLSIVPTTASGTVTLSIGGPVSPGSNNYYVETARLPIVNNPLDIIWGVSANPDKWGYPPIAYHNTTPPPDGNIGLKRGDKNLLPYYLLSSDGNQHANKVAYYSRVKVLSGNAKLWGNNNADYGIEYDGRALGATATVPVYIEPTGAVGQMVEIEIAYPLTPSSSEYYAEKAKFEIRTEAAPVNWNLTVKNYTDNSRISGVYIYSWDLSQHTENLVTVSGKAGFYGKLSGGGETFTTNYTTLAASGGILGNLATTLDAKYKVKLVVDLHQHYNNEDAWNGYGWYQGAGHSHTCNPASLIRDVQGLEVWFEKNITPSGTTGTQGGDIVLNRSSGGNANEVTLYANKLPPMQKVAKPLPNISPGTVPSGTNIVLTTATPGATIYYTTNELLPTRATATHGTPGNSVTIPIAGPSYTRIRAFAIKSDMLDSDPLDVTFSIESNPSTYPQGRASYSLTNDGLVHNSRNVALVFRPTTDSFTFEPYATTNKGLAPAAGSMKKIDPSKGETDPISWKTITEQGTDIIQSFYESVDLPGDTNAGSIKRGKYYVTAVSYYGGQNDAYVRNMAINAQGYKNNVWLPIDTANPAWLEGLHLYLTYGDALAGEQTVTSAGETPNLHLRAFKRTNTRLEVDDNAASYVKRLVFRPVQSEPVNVYTPPLADTSVVPYGVASVAKVGDATLGSFAIQPADLVFDIGVRQTMPTTTDSFNMMFFHLPQGRYWVCAIDENGRAYGYTATEWLWIDTTEMAYLGEVFGAAAGYKFGGFRFRVNFTRSGTQASPILRVFPVN